MRSMAKPFRLFTAGGLIALVLLAMNPSRSAAHLDFDGYVYDGNWNRKDPVNVLFDLNGSLNNTLEHVWHHLAWCDCAGNNMLFWEHGVGEWDQAQRGSDAVWAPYGRHHMRYNQGNDWEPYWGTWTMGPTHYEEVSWCGHASRSFDNSRSAVVNQFATAHSWGWLWKDNRLASQQCDGSWVAGDGYIAWIDI